MFKVILENSLIKQNSFGMNDLAIQKKELNNYLPKELKNTYYNYDTDFNVSNVLYFSLNAKDFMPNVN